MVRRVSLGKAECPIARALDVVGDWWSLLIIRDAIDGIRRFSEFQENLGVAKGILTTRLRDLVDADVLRQAPASDGSAYSEYILTEKGRDLFHVLVALRQWGEDHLYERGERHSVLIDNRSKRPVPRLELRSASGEVLSAANTTVSRLPRISATRKRSTKPDQAKHQ
ncbi:winged helix-turn-helix transcriptional regulator [Pendulispora albinea]|uniref:Helix-turn-helix transcriptional regulator n=1 Tax=Pendulispora albinea TaxID=2741071 RepID=A0ABZ2MA85_9BACT